MTRTLDRDLSAYVDEKRDRLVAILQDLVRIPSENMAPIGNEGPCQQYVSGFLSGCGWNPSVYSLNEVPGLKEHPLYWPGRDYTGRPNVGARLTGSGGGRSLVLSGHIDTVPAGDLPWTRSPFSGHVDGNLLYGRGSNDMKCGVATNLFVAEALRDLGLRLRGDLVFETIVDEEFGGSNGTLAGRLMGFNGDAAIISEPSFLRICAAQRGGRTAHITLSAGPNEGILSEGEFAAGVLHPLRTFLNAVPQFSEQRRKRAPAHPMYANSTDPVPVAITRISTAPWGTTEPTRIPDSCKLEMYWQAMPGEKLEDIDREFFEWLDAISQSLPVKPEVVFPIRWLPGSSIDAGEPLVRELATTAKETLGKDPPLAGIEGPCDMFIFQQAFGIPAVLWGARGFNTHNADEYVEIDTVVDAAKVLLSFVCRWCEAERESAGSRAA